MIVGPQQTTTCTVDTKEGEKLILESERVSVGLKSAYACIP
jgi:hypothetical protein